MAKAPAAFATSPCTTAEGGLTKDLVACKTLILYLVPFSTAAKKNTKKEKERKKTLSHKNVLKFWKIFFVYKTSDPKKKNIQKGMDPLIFLNAFCNKKQHPHLFVMKRAKLYLFTDEKRQGQIQDRNTGGSRLIRTWIIRIPA